jgi:surfactin synthase thioesterase subunit
MRNLELLIQSLAAGIQHSILNNQHFFLLGHSTLPQLCFQVCATHLAELYFPLQPLLEAAETFEDAE